jgi:dUTP pyrophosphatase
MKLFNKPVKVKIDARECFSIPEYSTIGSAGADLTYNGDEAIKIRQGERKLIPTGIYAEIPNGYELQIRPRSGLTVSHGVSVLNSPGTIDSDYRGEIMVILVNHGRKTFVVSKGDRIAQCVLNKYERIKFVESKKLSSTDRGDGGFGSTGK